MSVGWRIVCVGWAGSGIAGSGIAGSGMAGSGIASSGIAGSGMAGSGMAGPGIVSPWDCSMDSRLVSNVVFVGWKFCVKGFEFDEMGPGGGVAGRGASSSGLGCGCVVKLSTIVMIFMVRAWAVTRSY